MAAKTVSGQPDEPATLPRHLGVASLVLIVVAFNAPIAVMAGFAQLSIGFGNGIGAPLSFLIAGAILFTFAVGFVGMGRFIDNPGAFYCFIAIGLGKAPGLAGAFLATTAYLLMCAGSYPYMGLVTVDFMTRLTGDPVLSWGSWSIVFLAIITVTGFLRIDLSMKVLGKLVLIEIALVAIWQAAVMIKGGPEGYSLSSFTLSAFAARSPGLGVLFAMLCMIGIEAASCFSAETVNPEVAVGRATYISILFMAVFYGMGTWLYIVTQGASHVVEHATRDPVGSFFGSMDAYLGPFFVRVTSLVLVTSQMVSISSIQGSASRYLFALGRDKVLPAQLALVHGRLQSPYVAVAVVSVVSLAVITAIMLLKLDPVMCYAAITGMGIYFILPLMIATSCSVILFYRKNGNIGASLWTRLIAPLLSALALVVLFGLTTLNLRTLVGSQIMVTLSIAAVLGIPVAGWLLALAYRTRRPASYASIGTL